MHVFEQLCQSHSVSIMYVIEHMSDIHTRRANLSSEMLVVAYMEGPVV